MQLLQELVWHELVYGRSNAGSNFWFTVGSATGFGAFLSQFLLLLLLQYDLLLPVKFFVSQDRSQLSENSFRQICFQVRFFGLQSAEGCIFFQFLVRKTSLFYLFTAKKIFFSALSSSSSVSCSLRSCWIDAILRSLQSSSRAYELKIFHAQISLIEIAGCKKKHHVIKRISVSVCEDNHARIIAFEFYNFGIKNGDFTLFDIYLLVQHRNFFIDRAD